MDTTVQRVSCRMVKISEMEVEKIHRQENHSKGEKLAEGASDALSTKTVHNETQITYFFF